MGDELGILRDYLDVDRGLELRPEVVRRLRAGKRSKRKLGHDEFWAKASRQWQDIRRDRVARPACPRGSTPKIGRKKVST